jgi:hypothetical protein
MIGRLDAGEPGRQTVDARIAELEAEVARLEKLVVSQAGGDALQRHPERE